MEDLVKNLVGHSDISMHLVGWLLAGIGALATMLYKGLWKAINTTREDLDETRDVLNQLIGEHKVRHPKGE